MPKIMTTEREIGDLLIGYWQRKGFMVYSEVPITLHGKTVPIDLVAICDKLVIAVEMKQRLGALLVEQCLRLRGAANEIFAACLEPRNICARHKAAREVLGYAGIGLLYCRPDILKVSVQMDATHHPAPDAGVIMSELTVRQQGRAAGIAAGKRPRKDRWEAARALLEQNEHGMSGKLLGLHLEWSPSKRREFVKLASRGKIPGVRCDTRRTPYNFFRDAD